jgi:hypothetical protein
MGRLKAHPACLFGPPPRPAACAAHPRCCCCTCLQSYIINQAKVVFLNHRYGELQLLLMINN